jgi:hypothetical protein
VSAITGRLSEQNFRELARLTRRAHFRAAARHERERLAADAEPCRCEVCDWVRASGPPDLGDRDEMG